MKKINIIIIWIMLFGYCTTLSANKWRVNNSSSINADFSDLETALQSEKVLAGDTLYVEGSPNAYLISNIVKKVTLIGPGYCLTENPNTQENKAAAIIKSKENGSRLGILAEGFVAEGLTFDNSYLSIRADDVTLRKCYIANSINWESKSPGGQAIKNTVITQCFLETEIRGNNITSDSGYSDNAFITNNIMRVGISTLYNATIEYNTILGGHFSWGCIWNTNGSGSIRHNILSSELQTGQNGTMTMENNYLSESTSFVTNTTSTDGKYQLAANSDLKNKAPNGKEVGAFGGSSPYILSGLPNVPHIYEIIAPTSASAASGLDVILKIATEK